jgi:protein-histidine pros-kinase
VERGAMGLRTKFNLMLLLVAAVGVALFALASTPILEGLAREQVLQSSRIMMESAAGTRKYTSEQIAPLLAKDLRTTFHPQAVSAYAAKKNFDVLHGKFHDYTYREAALNPTNPEDRAIDWEADIINEFRNTPEKTEIVLERETPLGRTLNLARPLVNKQACMTCHSTAKAAPKSMLALYGSQNGFGWKVGETIGAQIVSVPMAVPIAQASRVRLIFLGVFLGVFALLFLLLNILLGAIVIGPIDRMAKIADAVSLGDMKAPEYVRGGSDQIASLSKAINRMRRSLQEALRMLSEE